MATKKRKRDRSASQTSGASMADLPVAIFFDIILKLPTRSIVMSKCVCKSWHDLISDPRFTKLHLAQAKPCILIRNKEKSRFSRALYMLEPEGGAEFSAGYCWCKSSDTCDLCRHRIEVKSVMKIPLRNANLLDANADVMFGSIGRRKIQGFVKVTSKIKDHNFSNIISCNGLLCLSENECIVICNPITGEFINLPESSNDEKNDTTISFGFSPKSDQYKVLRLFRTAQRSDSIVAEIHTLGTNSWRNIAETSLKLDDTHSAIPFNGALHWFCSGDSERYFHCIACFDLDEERFRSSLVPLPLGLRDKWDSLAMAVLGGRLSVYAFSNERVRQMEIWSMDETWTRLVCVDYSSVRLFRPLIRLSDGALLMFDGSNGLMHCDQSGGLTLKCIESRGWYFKAIAHTPSFVSLKDVVNTSAVEVFNVYSRCGKIKIREEAYSVYLISGRNMW